MSTNYLSNYNFESLNSDQLQPRKDTGAKLKTTVPPPPGPPKVITDVAELENNDPALTESVAAALLGMARGTLKKMRSRKQGPDYFRTETGSVHYLLSAVLDYR